MAASNPNGEMQYWINGQPFAAILQTTKDLGEMQYWINGQPFIFVVPQSNSSSDFTFALAGD